MSNRRFTSETGPTDGQPSAKVRAKAGATKRREDYRKNQALVARILKKHFGPLDQCDLDAWERQAYLMLVGLVYGRLVYGRPNVPVKDVVALAKVFGDPRRMDGGRRTGDPRRTPAEGPLPKQFSDIVKQIYGVTLPAK